MEKILYHLLIEWPLIDLLSLLLGATVPLVGWRKGLAFLLTITTGAVSLWTRKKLSSTVCVSALLSPEKEEGSKKSKFR